MSEHIEGLTDEVMCIIEQSADGLTLGDIYDRSELADAQQAVAGAVHRLTTKGVLVRGTDKRVRTKGQAKKSAAQPPAPTKPDTGPGKSQPTGGQRAPLIAELSQCPDGLNQGDLLQRVSGEKANYKLQLAVNDLVKAGLATKTGRGTRAHIQLTEKGRAHKAAQGASTQAEKVAREKAGMKVSSKPAIRDAMPAQLEKAQRLTERFSCEVHGLPPVSERFVEDLEQASVDAQVRLDYYLNQLGDPLLEHLIEAASAAKDVAEAARRVAGGERP